MLAKAKATSSIVAIIQVNVQENVIWAEFGKVIDDITINEQIAKEVFNRLLALEKNNTDSDERQKIKIKNALNDIGKRKIKLYEDLSSGLLDELTYRRLLKKVNEDEVQLEKRKKDFASQNSEQILKNAESILELCKELKSLWVQMPEGKKLEVVKRLCSNPRLNGRSIEYDLKKPFEILRKLSNFPTGEIWCPWRESNPHAFRH